MNIYEVIETFSIEVGQKMQQTENLTDIHRQISHMIIEFLLIFDIRRAP